MVRLRDRGITLLRRSLGREPFTPLFFVSYEGALSDEDRKAPRSRVGSSKAGDEAKRLILEALGREQSD